MGAGHVGGQHEAGAVRASGMPGDGRVDAEPFRGPRPYRAGTVRQRRPTNPPLLVRQNPAGLFALRILLIRLGPAPLLSRPLLAPAVLGKELGNALARDPVGRVIQ